MRDKVDHRTRGGAYQQAMGRVAQKYPEDREATVFHALALAVSPARAGGGPSRPRPSRRAPRGAERRQEQLLGATGRDPTGRGERLVGLADGADAERRELRQAKAFLGSK